MRTSLAPQGISEALATSEAFLLHVPDNADRPHQKPSPQKDPSDDLVGYELENQESPGSETNKNDSYEISASNVAAPCFAIDSSFLLINTSHHLTFLCLRVSVVKMFNPCLSAKIRGQRVTAYSPSDYSGPNNRKSPSRTSAHTSPP
jgi:hypothetical protein